jgi:hypothetical protein
VTDTGFEPGSRVEDIPPTDDAEPTVATGNRRLERRTWWATFVLLLVIGSMWALAMPPATGPDEGFQLFRASGVVRGEVTGSRLPDVGELAPWRTLVLRAHAPGPLVTLSVAAGCFSRTPLKDSASHVWVILPVGCAVGPEPENNASVYTNQYRGQPSYYYLVGWLTLVAPNRTGTYLMRLVSLAIGAAFVASAFASARRLPWPQLASVGVFVTLAPMVLYLASTVNPAFLEIASALGAWTALAALLVAHVPADRRLVARFGLALATLLAVRGLSPLFAAGLVTATLLAVPDTRRRVRALWDRRDLRSSFLGWAAIAALGLLSSVVWLIYIGRSYPLPGITPAGARHAVGHLFSYAHQSVGIFSNNGSGLPRWAVVAWLVAAGSVFTLGVAASRLRTAIVAVAVIFAGLALNISEDGFGFPPIGYYWQARYTLPFLVGAFVLATAAPRRARVPRLQPVARWLVPAALTVIVAVQAVAFTATLEQMGAMPASKRFPNARLSLRRTLFDPNWRPPLVPPVVYLAVFTVAVAGLAWFAWRSSGGSVTDSNRVELEG